MAKGDPERTGVMAKTLHGQARRVHGASEAVVAAGRPRRTARVPAYTIPTDEPESDGTLEWDSTTIVVVEAHAGGMTGSATPTATGRRRRRSRRSSPASSGRDALDVRARLGCDARRRSATRAGRASAAMAMSAVDIALWDLKARLLGVPLVDAARRAHDGSRSTAAAASRSYSDERLREQLGGWVEAGHPAREDEGRPRARARPGTRVARRARRSATTSS